MDATAFLAKLCEAPAEPQLAKGFLDTIETFRRVTDFLKSLGLTDSAIATKVWAILNIVYKRLPVLLDTYNEILAVFDKEPLTALPA